MVTDFRMLRVSKRLSSVWEYATRMRATKGIEQSFSESTKTKGGFPISEVYATKYPSTCRYETKILSALYPLRRALYVQE